MNNDKKILNYIIYHSSLMIDRVIFAHKQMKKRLYGKCWNVNNLNGITSSRIFYLVIYRPKNISL